ncbi:unnamed protein product, partial [marine sediment metagenome]
HFETPIFEREFDNYGSNITPRSGTRPAKI